jgi:hypothetical protein
LVGAIGDAPLKVMARKTAAFKPITAMVTEGPTFHAGTN